MDQRFATDSWKGLGDALGQNQSVKQLSLIVCNLNQGKNMYELMKGLMNNNSI